MKKHLIIGLFLCLCILASVQYAFATDVKITCVPPTKYTDATDIGAAPITYNLFGGLTGQPKQKLVAAATACSFTRTNVAIGTQEYYVTAVVGQGESDPSQTASIVVAPPPPKKPNSPGNITVITITVEAP